MSGFWFSSLLAVEEPRRVKVRVKRKTTPETARKCESANGSYSNSDPILSLADPGAREEKHEDAQAAPQFRTLEEELAYYKNKCKEQEKEIIDLRQLPQVQESLFEERLKREREIREHAEENVATMAEQRDMAQIMYSNSDTALNTLQAQLGRERSLMQHEIKAMKEGLAGSRSTNGQLTLMSPDHATEAQRPLEVLAAVENALESMGSAVTEFLSEWDALRMKELQVLSQICGAIEQRHQAMQNTGDHSALLQLTDKLNHLMHLSRREAGGEPAAATVEDDTVWMYERAVVQPNRVASRVLEGGAASPPTNLDSYIFSADPVQPEWEPQPAQAAVPLPSGDNVLASLLLFGGNS